MSGDFSGNMILAGGRFKKEEEYWTKKLEGCLTAGSFPYDYSRSEASDYSRAVEEFEFPEHLTQAMEKMCSNSYQRLFIILEAGIKALLLKYTGNEDITTGSPIYKKNVEGKLLNTVLLLREQIAGHMTFKEMVLQTRKTITEADENQNYSLEELYKKLYIQTDIPLIDTVVLLENVHEREYINKMNPSIIFSFNHSAGAIHGRVEYNSLLYIESTIQTIVRHMLRLFEKVIENVDIEIDNIQLLDEKEKQKILVDFNDTKTSYPKDKTLHELFEEQVENAPNKVALFHNGIILTYKELNEKANRLARFLRKKEVGADCVIGILFGNPIETIISIWAILKAGGAYLPIGLDYPIARILTILNDSGSPLLLTDSNVCMRYRNLLNDLKAKPQTDVIFIDEIQEVLSEESPENLKNICNAENLAYVMYTSGTTGIPKGNLTMHYNISRVVLQTNYIEITEQDRILQLSNYAFDGSTFNIFGALLNGAELVLIDNTDIIDLDKLASIIKDRGVTLFFITTALFNALVDYSIECLSGVRKILVGGEKLSVSHVRKALAYLGKGRIINGYGPTESTVFATSYMVNELDERVGNIPIGKPLSNTRIYIVNKKVEIQPIMVEGELCIAGDGLIREYLNRDDLNKEKFISNPYKPGEKMYKTGDLARWLPNGNIEFLGRKDQQVKLRGFRIELGEVESQLLKHGWLKEALVVDRQDVKGSKYLCAYFVADEKVEQAELKEHLSKVLPDFMIPAYFKQIEKMPLTVNGKIDRKALSQDNMGKAEEYPYEEPTNEVERYVVKAWEEVLGIERIGIDDNFFRIGGNSINAIHITLKLAAEFEINVNQIFQHQTVRTLAREIIFKKESLKSSIRQLKEKFYREDAVGWDVKLQQKYKEYVNRNKVYSDISLLEENAYDNILMVGCTGYLGINLLYELISGGSSNIYLLVRAGSIEEAKERVKSSCDFYFGISFYDKHKHRLTIVNGDLTIERMGLDSRTYDDLAVRTDCIINSAANVRHYGVYNDFYRINVEGTKRLLDFAKYKRPKVFCHISTMSVGSGFIEGEYSALFTEYDIDLGQKIENYYVQTKLEAEKLLVEARSRGLNANIFRVGNLVFNSGTGNFQRNIGENAFYTSLKCMTRLGVVPNIEQKTIDFSYIDYVSKAVVLLLSRRNLKNETYHIYNPNFVSLKEIGTGLERLGYMLQHKDFDEYLNFLEESYEKKEWKIYAEHILLQLGVFEKVENTKFLFTNDKTILILQRLGFNWSELNDSYMKKMLDYCKKVDFI